MAEHDTRVTTDHEEIRRWIDSRGGRPATVKGTPAEQESVGLLRVDFPGYSGNESLERVSWEEFFQKFEDSDLAFIYQEMTRDGQESRFCKFVSRRTAGARA